MNHVFRTGHTGPWGAGRASPSARSLRVLSVTLPGSRNGKRRPPSLPIPRICLRCPSAWQSRLWGTAPDHEHALTTLTSVAGPGGVPVTSTHSPSYCSTSASWRHRSAGTRCRGRGPSSPGLCGGGASSPGRAARPSGDGRAHVPAQRGTETGGGLQHRRAVCWRVCVSNFKNCYRHGEKHGTETPHLNWRGRQVLRWVCSPARPLSARPSRPRGPAFPPRPACGGRGCSRCPAGRQCGLTRREGAFTQTVTAPMCALQSMRAFEH